MTQQYFFLFSNGDYLNNEFNDLQMCDHEVTASEWVDHYLLHSEKCATGATAAILAYCERVGCTPSFDHRGKPQIPMSHYYDYIESPEYMAHKDWDKVNDPKKTFKELHNMVSVKYTKVE